VQSCGKTAVVGLAKRMNIEWVLCLAFQSFQPSRVSYEVNCLVKLGICIGAQLTFNICKSPWKFWICGCNVWSWWWLRKSSRFRFAAVVDYEELTLESIALQQILEGRLSKSSFRVLTRTEVQSSSQQSRQSLWNSSKIIQQLCSPISPLSHLSIDQ
jgi:hypothetical protein